jgi:hypothetical protein
MERVLKVIGYGGVARFGGDGLIKKEESRTGLK